MPHGPVRGEALRRALALAAARTLRAALAVGAAWLVVARPAFQTTASHVLAAVTLFGLAGALLLARRRVHGAEAAWSAMFLLHFVGHATNVYNLWWPYDTLVHATSGALGAFAAVSVARATGLFFDRATPFRVAYVAFSAVILGGFAVEALEYATDGSLGTLEQTDPAQSPLVDTMTDVLAEAATGLLVALLLAAHAATRRGAVTAPLSREAAPAPRINA